MGFLRGAMSLSVKYRRHGKQQRREAERLGAFTVAEAELGRGAAASEMPLKQLRSLARTTWQARSPSARRLRRPSGSFTRQSSNGLKEGDWRKERLRRSLRGGGGRAKN